MKHSYLVWVLLGLISLEACKPSQPGTTSAPKQTKQPEEVLLTLGTKPIYQDEFLYLYQKNYREDEEAFTEKSIREYLDLFVKFKLKIAEAEARGLHQDKAFKDEFEGYRQQLARPYLTEREITDQLVKEAYERYKTEVNASHILIKVQSNTPPADTLKAWEKINEIYQGLQQKDADFAQAAKAHSEDGSAPTGGKLGWFTSMQMIYDFEDVAYKTPVGGISKPFRTQFGYHIIQVHERRPSRGEVQVAHIMVRATEGISAADSLAAYRKIESIKEKLQEGQDWDQLCAEFSDDPRSQKRGGEMQWMKPGSGAPPAFENAAFQLQNIGQVIGPVQTPYGWHLIKLLDKRQLASFGEMEKSIQNRIKRDTRAEISRARFIEKLKKSNDFKDNHPGQKIAKELIANMSRELTEGKWQPDTTQEGMNETLFTIMDRKYTVKEMAQYMAKTQISTKRETPSAYAQSLYERFVSQSLVDYEEEHLSEKYPEYRHLVKEYRDGILLFKIMEDEVWGKASKDTTGLRMFFDAKKTQYKWQKRAKAKVFSVIEKSYLDSVRQELNASKWPVYGLAPTSASFQTSDTELQAKARAALDPLSYQLRRHSDYLLEVTCGLRKGESQNLSIDRFEMIVSYLEKVNIDRSRLIFRMGAADLGSAEAQVSLQLFSDSPKALEGKYNRQEALTIKVHDGWFETGDLEEVDAVEWEVGEHTIEKGGRHVLVIISELADPQFKRFQETKGQVISDYQNHLEDEWIKTLTAKYPVEVKEEVIQGMIKK